MENKIFKKISLKSEGRLFGWGISPDADWKVILISTLILVVLVSTWNFMTFMKISRGDAFATEALPEETKPLLDVEALKGVVTYYQAKAERFSEIIGEGVSVVDPSI